MCAWVSAVWVKMWNVWTQTHICTSCGRCEISFRNLLACTSVQLFRFPLPSAHWVKSSLNWARSVKRSWIGTFWMRAINHELVTHSFPLPFRFLSNERVGFANTVTTVAVVSCTSIIYRHFHVTAHDLRLNAPSIAFDTERRVDIWK